MTNEINEVENNQRCGGSNMSYCATSEQWAAIEELADSALYGPSCILELRARVEALEEAENDRRFRECSATIDNAKSAPNLKQIRSSLVERVHSCIVGEPECGHMQARATIREVAAWLKQNGGLAAQVWSEVIEQEAER